MKEKEIVPIQTAIRGRKAKLPTSWHIEKDEEGNYYVTCPNQQAVKAEPTKTRFKACYDSAICSACASSAVAQKHCYCYYFTEEDFLSK